MRSETGIITGLRSSMKVLGFSESSTRLGARVYTFMAAQGVMLFVVTSYLLDEWDDVDVRINVLKSLAYVGVYTAYSVSTALNWREFSSVVRIFRSELYEFPYEVSAERERLTVSFDAVMRKMNRVWWIIGLVYVVTLTVFPAAIVVVRVSLFSEDFQQVIKEDLSVPFQLYYPECIERFKGVERQLYAFAYAVNYAFDSLYMTATGFYSHLIHVTSVCSMIDVEYELKLLRLSLLEMDRLIGRADDSYRFPDANASNEAASRFMNYFVRHHQEAYRKYRLVSGGIRWMAASLSTTASLYICMAIYTVVQKEQALEKLQEMIFLILWSIAIYLLDSCGERIQTEGENLRNALYECSWMDKPNRFKTSLLICMARSRNPIDVRPFGIFALNLNNFAKTMNAAYSYYNLLHKFKGK